MPDPLDSFAAFAAAVRARLEQGRSAYGDRSFGRPVAELVGEIRQELLDVAGWAYIALQRVDSAPAPRALPPGDSRDEPIPGPRVGRMVVVPSHTVVCVPLLAMPVTPGEAPAWRELPPVALSRVPVQGECMVDAEGRTLHVLGVRHLQGEVAAELHCEHLEPKPVRAAPSAQLEKGSGEP